MNAKPSISFLSTNTDSQLSIAIGHILDSMTGNARFTDPVPHLDAIAAARDAYVTAVNALDRSKAATVRRNDARAAVVQLLRDLALYVQHASKGELATLLSSGFPAQRTRGKPSSVLPAPQNVRVLPGKVSGQLRARSRTVPDAKSYQWRYATAAAPTAWTLLDPVTTASITLTGLTRGTDYLVQVRAIGSKGAGNWSDAATLMAT